MHDANKSGLAGREISMTMMLPLLHRIAAVCIFAALFCSTLTASTISKLNDDVLSPLRGPVVAKRLRLNKVPLYDHGTATIDLEEFQVWAPGGKVVVHDGKNVQYLEPP